MWKQQWSRTYLSAVWVCVSVHFCACYQVWVRQCVNFLSMQHALARSIQSWGCSFICLRKAECQGVATMHGFDHKTIVTQIKKMKQGKQLICGQLKLLPDLWCQARINAPRNLLQFYYVLSCWNYWSTAIRCFLNRAEIVNEKTPAIANWVFIYTSLSN